MPSFRSVLGKIVQLPSYQLPVIFSGETPAADQDRDRDMLGCRSKYANRVSTHVHGLQCT